MPAESCNEFDTVLPDPTRSDARPIARQSEMSDFELQLKPAVSRVAGFRLDMAGID